MPKIQMQNILNLIDSIPEVSLDITDNIIKSIDSINVSEMSITDIRSYIEYARQELKKNLTKGQNDCYNNLLIKLTIEKENRPFHEQFPDINTNIDKMIKETALLLEANKIHSNQIGNLQNINAKRDKELEAYVNVKIKNHLKDGVILASGYRYKGMQGESDGIIVGKDTYNEDIIIFVETKFDIDKEYKEAISQSVRNVGQWELLLDMTKEDFQDPENTGYLQDYEALKAEKYRHYKIVRGFGGSKFQESTIKGRFKMLKGSLLFVIKNNNQGDEVIYKR